VCVCVCVLGIYMDWGFLINSTYGRLGESLGRKYLKERKII
jgi:hypothetical protein